MKFTISALLLSLATTAQSWRTIDKVTLHFWSPPSLCTKENYDNGNTCSRSAIDDINVTLDNTGAICYTNPMGVNMSNSTWFSWLGPKTNDSISDLWLYQLRVPEGQPVPQCDERGVCDPCDVLTGDTANKSDYGFKPSPSPTESGCAVSRFVPAQAFHPTNYCGPFQGNITVEAGDPETCVSQGITTAAKCGEVCDKNNQNLKKAVFANNENGEVACCTCTAQNDIPLGICKGADSSLCIANDTPSGSNKVVTIGAMLFVAANAVYFI